MSRGDAPIVRGLRCALLGLTAIGTLAVLSAGQADARLHHRHTHSAHFGGGHKSGNYQPPYAAIVVDANSGQVLEAENPDSPRHPASVTKVMTLYLLFEQLDAGRVKLDSRLPVSAHAAAQDPTKLGLEPGQSIAAEDAIKAVVTKSANDVAVVIAEAIGGSEDEFARMMTRKAHALGMTRTTYVNASGLPNDDQITTARDQALLGRAIHDRFPRLFHYFSTLAFQYHGDSIRNHNHLLGRVDGVDGIKTGFTRASGFNLLCSVHRGNRHIVGVVMGGSSGEARDARMRSLIEQHISEASTRRTVSAVADLQEEAPGTRAQVRVARADPDDAPGKPANRQVDVRATGTTAVLHPGSTDPIQPVQVKTISLRAAAPRPVMTAPVTGGASQPAIAPQSVTIEPAASEPRLAATGSGQIAYAPPGPAEQPGPLNPPPPSSVTRGRPGVLGTLALHVPGPGTAEPSTPAAEQLRGTPTPSAPASRPASSRGGYVIQLGAFADETEAKQRLKAAQNMAQNLLGNADPFTERVVKGSKEFFRARFVGLEKAEAEAACKYFHRNDIACMALRSN